MTNELIALPKLEGAALEPSAALLAKHASCLALNDAEMPRCPVADSPLIPRGDLPGLIAGLEAQARPATKREVAAAIALISSAWPFSWQKLDHAVVDGFLRQLQEDLATFPPDILLQSIRTLRQTKRFAPAIADIVELASGPTHERRMRLELALGHQAEYAKLDLRFSSAIPTTSAQGDVTSRPQT